MAFETSLSTKKVKNFTLIVVRVVGKVSDDSHGEVAPVSRGPEGGREGMLGLDTDML